MEKRKVLTNAGVQNFTDEPDDGNFWVMKNRRKQIERAQMLLWVLYKGNWNFNGLIMF